MAHRFVTGDAVLRWRAGLGIISKMPWFLRENSDYVITMIRTKSGKCDECIFKRKVSLHSLIIRLQAFSASTAWDLYHTYTYLQSTERNLPPSLKCTQSPILAPSGTLASIHNWIRSVCLCTTPQHPTYKATLIDHTFLGSVFSHLEHLIPTPSTHYGRSTSFIHPASYP